MHNLTYLDLSYNDLNGTLPQNLFKLSNLTELRLANNYFYGTISTQIIKLTKIARISLNLNFFTGSIPPHMRVLKNLQGLSLGFNQFTGTIPNDISELPQLNTFDINQNSFTGTLPANLSSCRLMHDLDLSYNLFHGEIPSSYADMHFLLFLFINSNLITGTVSQSMISHWAYLVNINLTQNSFSGKFPDFGNNNLMFAVEAANNQFTSTLPSSMVETLDLDYIVVGNNYLTGTIPQNIGNMSATHLNRMKTFDITNNSISGTIPATVNNLHRLVNFLLFTNLLTGTLPVMTNMSSLETFLAQDNYFHGNLHDLFAAPQVINNIDVSANHFTGGIPSSVFDLPDLNTFAAVSNCLSGALPYNICNATLINTLALDGLSASAYCQKAILPSHSRFKAYLLPNALQGGIPLCLFAMKHLQSLHLSGNGIMGTLPDDLKLSPSLVDLSLSHNVLHGDIPRQIQAKRWSNLDLSYNRLNGILNEDFARCSEESTIALDVNRLSGHVPKNVTDAVNIKLLQGSIFDCKYSKDSLPRADEDFLKYDCGSNSFYLSVYIWCVIAGVWFVLIAVAVANYKKITIWLGQLSVAQYLTNTLGLFIEWMAVFEVKPLENFGMVLVEDGVHTLGRFIADIRQKTIFVCCVLLFVVLPIFSILSNQYQTYTYLYAWTASAMYMSGVQATAGMMVVLILFLALLMYYGHQFKVNAQKQVATLQIVPFGTPTKPPVKITWTDRFVSALHSSKYLLRLSPAIVINCAVMVMVNIGYVYVTEHYNVQVVTASQITLAAFKLTWNDFVVRKLLSMVIKGVNSSVTTQWDKDSEDYKALSIVKEDVAFRTAVLLFNNILTPCLAIAIISPDCFYNIVDTPAPVHTSYSVCYGPRASSALTSVCTTADVELEPIGASASTTTPQRPNSSRLMSMVRVASTAGSTSERYQALFFCRSRFILRVINEIAVLVTFGAVFPPLALFICLAMVNYTLFTQLMIGRFLTSAQGHKDYSAVKQILDRECEGVSAQFTESMMQDVIHDLASTFLNEFKGSDDVTIGYAGMGFITAYNKLRKSDIAPCNTLMDDIVKGAASCPGGLVITGHSLGGALATLCAVDFLKSKRLTPKLITFGAPRAFKPNLSRHIDTITDFENCRIINHGDPIPLLPPSIAGIYRHCGQAYFFKVPEPVKTEAELAQERENEALYKDNHDELLAIGLAAKASGWMSASADKSNGEWFQMDHNDFHGEFPDVMKALVDEIQQDVTNMSSILTRVLLEIDIACHDLVGYGQHLVGYMERAGKNQ
eukprot:gene24643-31011_t